MVRSRVLLIFEIGFPLFSFSILSIFGVRCHCCCRIDRSFACEKLNCAQIRRKLSIRFQLSTANTDVILSRRITSSILKQYDSGWMLKMRQQTDRQTIISQDFFLSSFSVASVVIFSSHKINMLIAVYIQYGRQEMALGLD